MVTSPRERRIFVLRLDERSADPGSSTLLDDVYLLRDEHIEPILIAPDAAAARAVVRILNRRANVALKLSGSDAAMLPKSGDTIGRVNAPLLQMLLDHGYVPVIAPTAFAAFSPQDAAVIADDVASVVAAATAAERALFFHPEGGIRDGERDGVIESLTAAEALAIADDPSTAPDVAALLRAAARGVRAGVDSAHILDGGVAHAALVELMTAQRIGTTVTGGVVLAA